MKLCNYLAPAQRDILIEYTEQIGNTYAEIAELARKKQEEWRVFNLSEIEDPQTRAAVEIAIYETSDLGAWSNGDQFHIDAAAIGVVAAFELLCTELMQRFFILRPEAITGSQAVPLNLALSSDSIKDLLRRFAQERAREVTYTATEDWLPFLATHCGITLHKRASEWPESWRSFCWLAARRNSIIHAGGAADDKLLTKASRLGMSTQVHSTRVRLSGNEVHDSAYHTVRAATELLFGFIANQTSAGDRSQTLTALAMGVADLQLALADRGLAQLAYSMKSHILPDSESVNFWNIAQWTVMVLVGYEEQARTEASQAQWPSLPIYQLLRETLVGTPDSTRTALENALSDEFTMVDALFSRKYILLKRMMHRNPESFDGFRLDASDPEDPTERGNI